MTKSLPAKPSLIFLRKEAKSIRKAVTQQDASVCSVLRNLHHFQNQTDQEILESKIPLQEVQFALALEYGFKDWKALTSYVESSKQIEKNAGTINYSKINLRANGFIYDSFCLAVAEAARLLGGDISYEDTLALTTNAFAPGFDICNDCKDLWLTEAWLSRAGSAESAWASLGLSVKPLAFPSEKERKPAEIREIIR